MILLLFCLSSNMIRYLDTIFMCVQKYTFIFYGGTHRLFSSRSSFLKPSLNPTMLLTASHIHLLVNAFTKLLGSLAHTASAFSPVMYSPSLLTITAITITSIVVGSNHSTKKWIKFSRCTPSTTWCMASRCRAVASSDGSHVTVVRTKGDDWVLVLSGWLLGGCWAFVLLLLAHHRHHPWLKTIHYWMHHCCLYWTLW